MPLGRALVDSRSSEVPEGASDAARLALPSDRSFDSYENALTTVQRPRLSDDEELMRDQTSGSGA